MDLDGVALAAIKGLSVQVNALQAENATLVARVVALELLEARIAALEL